MFKTLIKKNYWKWRLFSQTSQTPFVVKNKVGSVLINTLNQQVGVIFLKDPFYKKVSSETFKNKKNLKKVLEKTNDQGKAEEAAQTYAKFFLADTGTGNKTHHN